MTKHCKACLAECGDSKFCPNCGALLAQKPRKLRDKTACPKCRARNQHGRFCGSCGDRLYREGGTPTIRLYARVSSEGQKQSGLGIQVQKRGLAAYAERLKDTMPDAEVVWYVDEAQSARKLPLKEREHGAHLWADVNPGDHVVFYNTNRGFRKRRETYEVVDGWLAQSISVHFCNFGAAMGSMGTKMLLAILAIMDEEESDRISERVCSSLSEMRDNGLLLSGNVPRGYKAVPNGRTNRRTGRPVLKIVPDMEARALMASIVYLRDEKRLQWDKLHCAVEWYFAVQAGAQDVLRFTGLTKNPSLRWLPQTMGKLYKDAKKLQPLPPRLPIEPLPQEIIDECSNRARRALFSERQQLSVP